MLTRLIHSRPNLDVCSCLDSELPFLAVRLGAPDEHLQHRHTSSHCAKRHFVVFERVLTPILKVVDVVLAVANLEVWSMLGVMAIVVKCPDSTAWLLAALVHRAHLCAVRQPHCLH